MKLFIVEYFIIGNKQNLIRGNFVPQCILYYNGISFDLNIDCLQSCHIGYFDPKLPLLLYAKKKKRSLYIIARKTLHGKNS